MLKLRWNAMIQLTPWMQMLQNLHLAQNMSISLLEWPRAHEHLYAATRLHASPLQLFCLLLYRHFSFFVIFQCLCLSFDLVHSRWVIPVNPAFSWNSYDGKLVSPWSSAKFSHDGMFTSTSPQAKFVHNLMVMSSGSKGLDVIWQIIKYSE